MYSTKNRKILLVDCAVVVFLRESFFEGRALLEAEVQIQGQLAEHVRYPSQSKSFKTKQTN